MTVHITDMIFPVSVTVTETGKIMSVICTLMYFAFFLLMPVYTSIEKTYEVPDRL